MASKWFEPFALGSRDVPWLGLLGSGGDVIMVGDKRIRWWVVDASSWRRPSAEEGEDPPRRRWGDVGDTGDGGDRPSLLAAASHLAAISVVYTGAEHECASWWAAAPLSSGREIE